MSNSYLLTRDISDKVLMIGVSYKNNARGGMASVIQYYSKYFETLRYISSWKNSNNLIKLCYAISAYIETFFTLLFDRKIKIVHIHTAATNSFLRKVYFINLGKFFHKKIITHIHGGEFKNFFGAYKNKEEIIHNINKADKLIVLSSSWREWFFSIGIIKDKIVILNNIVEYPSRVDNYTSSKIKLIYLGVLRPQKGIFDVLQTLSKNKEYYRNKITLRIGGAENEENLLAYITDNDLAEFVIFEGWVNETEKVELLNWADILILPSYAEGLPVSILEAMSYGCAIIASSVGGIPEIIHNNKNGLLVTPGDQDAIHNAISYMIQNSNNIKKFGEKNKEIVKDFFPSAVIPRLKEIYLSLL
jgi:glycosyltransferase involved in cell wall biosynthesis